MSMDVGQPDIVPVSPINDRLFAIVVELAKAALVAEAKAGGNVVRHTVARLRAALLDQARSASWRNERDASHTRSISISTALELTSRLTEKIPDQMTRELWRKRRGNPVHRLHETGKIGDLELKAAWTIQDVAAQCTASGALGVIQYDADKVDVSARDYLWPPGSTETQHVIRQYGIWRQNCERGGLPVEAILDILVSGLSIREAERKHLVRNGTLTAILKEALHSFTITAGWRPLDLTRLGPQAGQDDTRKT